MKDLYLFLCLSLLASLPAQTNHPSAPAPMADIQSRRDQLFSKVSSLQTTGDEGSKRSVLLVALERSKACSDDAYHDEAMALLDDVESSLMQPAKTMVAPSTNTGTISAIKPPQAVQGNPYL